MLEFLCSIIADEASSARLSHRPTVMSRARRAAVAFPRETAASPPRVGRTIVARSPRNRRAPAAYLSQTRRVAARTRRFARKNARNCQLRQAAT
jgi:hypothetical protein